MLNTMEEVMSYVNEKVNEHLYNKNVTVEYSNRMTTCLGRCEQDLRFDRYKLVFNLKYIKANLGNENHIENTVLHEIAHALAGGLHHHDSYWVSVCRAIGGNGERLADNTKIIKHRVHKYKCPVCGKIYKFARRKNRRISCGECSDVFNEKYLLEYIGCEDLTK